MASSLEVAIEFRMTPLPSRVTVFGSRTGIFSGFAKGCVISRVWALVFSLLSVSNFLAKSFTEGRRAPEAMGVGEVSSITAIATASGNAVCETFVGATCLCSSPSRGLDPYPKTFDSHEPPLFSFTGVSAWLLLAALRIYLAVGFVVPGNFCLIRSMHSSLERCCFQSSRAYWTLRSTSDSSMKTIRSQSGSRGRTKKTNKGAW